MMQTTDFGNLARPCPPRRPLDGPGVRRILLQREVSSSAVIIGEVAGQDTAEVLLVEHEDMVQTLAPDRADEPFPERVLPRALGRGQYFPDSHALHAVPKRVPVDRVAIAEEVGRRGVVRERLHELLGSPGRGGMLGDVEVDDPPPMVGEHDEDEQHAPVSGRHGKKIDGDEGSDVVGEEGAPGLRRRDAALGDQPGDGALGDVDAELLEFACVQSNADVFSGGSPAGARASSPVAWMAGQRETDALEPIDEALGRRVSESPGRNESERRGSPETEEPRRPSGWELREGSRDPSHAGWRDGALRRGGSGGTVTRTRRATGETLLVPPRNRRSWVGRITGAPGKSADDERVAEGSAVAGRRGNARGAKLQPITALSQRMQVPSQQESRQLRSDTRLRRGVTCGEESSGVKVSAAPKGVGLVERRATLRAGA